MPINPSPVSLSEPGTALLAQYFQDRARRSRSHLGKNWDELERIDTAQLEEQFARYLSQLPEGDLRVVALSRLVPTNSDGTLAPGPKVSAALGSIRLYGSSGLGVFLESLVHAAIDDVVSQDQHLGSSFADLGSLGLAHGD